MVTKEDIIGYDAIWDSAMKCKQGVSWKPSVKELNINAVEEVYKIVKKLENGTWKDGKPRPIKIWYPKKRDGLSISIHDRIYQRSINDVALYPAVTKSFILDNCACQKGKGIDFARARTKKHIHNFFLKYGLTGYVLQIDVHGYYPNMRHDVVNAKFKRYLNPDVHKMVCDVLDTQYVGDVGYNPGSQMVQIAGIAVLDDLDHYCKEQLHIVYYIRYMDDILILCSDKHQAQTWLSKIEVELKKIGFTLNPTKTQIIPVSKGFTFLGFEYHVTKTGKIIMTLNSDNIKHERKRLQHLVRSTKKKCTAINAE